MLFRYGIAALASVCIALAADDTESTSTLTIQSFVTVVASAPPTSDSATSTNGLGDYIMRGLSESSIPSTAQVLPGPVTAPFPSKNATAATGWEACQTSQISWSDAWSSAYQPEVVTQTYTYTGNYYTLTSNVTLGNSDVYTTIDGIPHAHGEIEPTSISQFVEVYSETTVRSSSSTTSLDTTFTISTPKCTIAPSKCTALWQTYLEEHGMPTTFENATEPAITPVPTDRPRCSVGNVTNICKPTPTPSCVLIASKVDLYYWPSITAAPNASLTTTNSSEIVTQVVGNITMTSPSVYLVFDHLQAMSSTNLDPTCSLSSPLGATSTIRMAGGGAIRPIGGPYTNAVVSLDAIGLSSLVRDLGAVNTASVVSEIAHGGPSYSYWINAVRGTGHNYGTGYYSSVMAKSVDYADFMVPNAEAYYMNINGAPGCNRMGDHPQCSTIYDGAYKAQLLVPKEARDLRPEWAECSDPLFGALDPPIALTQVATIKGPSTPPAAPIALIPADTIQSPKPSPEPTKEISSKETTPSDQPTQTDPATPGHTVPSGAGPTPPPSKSSPTALPATNPDDQPNTQSPSNPDDKPANGNPSTNDNPSNNGNPSSNDKPSNHNNPSDDDKPKDNGDDSPESQTQNGASADKPQNDAFGSSTSDDQNAAAGDSDKKPQNALDVLTAAQQSAEAKATASPGSGNSEGPGNGVSADSGSSNNHDGASGATESSSNENSGATQGQGSGENLDGNQSNGPQTGSNDHNSDGDNGSEASSGSDANDGPAEQVVSIDGKTHTIAEQNGVPVIDGTPLPPNGSPMTVDGQFASAVDGGVVIGTQTIDLTGSQTADSQAEQVIDIDGKTHTIAEQNGFPVIDGTPLPTDGSPVTIDEQSVNAMDGAVVIGTQTIHLTGDQTADSQAAVITANGQAFTAMPGSDSGVAIVDGRIISIGGQAVTVQGATISAVSNGVVLDGSTIGYEDASSTANPAVLTFGSNVVTASEIGSEVFVIGTVTLTAGGSDATISGHTVSAATTGIVVDGSSNSKEAGKTQSSQATQTISTDQDDNQPTAAGSEASRLLAMYWVALLGIGLLLLI